ncbi:hypothetical protein PIB30_007079 [Stylosanthes scabra]|uniref:Uncharacterized protein n=1 Tax=Stylosanthes scabra TaxID=79078 RepID=A0ABU6R4X9_9FABA|nr:hypothetical protein [Stylosanthes scabra]
MNKANIDKGPEVFTGRFLLGLNQDIVDEVEVYNYATMDDLLNLAIEAKRQQQRLVAWFNSISTRDSDRAKFDNTTTFKVANLKTHPIDHPQMVTSSNPDFTSSKVDLEELLEDVVSENVVLEEPKMQTVSQEILGCEESDNQEELKKQLRKEESETISDCFNECKQKIFEKPNKNCEEDLKCASILPFENFMGIMVSVECLKVDRQEARQAAAYFHEHLHILCFKYSTYIYQIVVYFTFDSTRDLEQKTCINYCIGR